MARDVEKTLLTPTLEETQDELIKHGKSRGLLSYGKVVQTLQPFGLSKEALNSFCNKLAQYGIEIVYETPNDFPDEIKKNNSEEDVKGEAGVLPSIPEEPAVNNAVHMYFWEISKIPLLTFEEEAELGRAIADQVLTIRVPAHMVEKCNKMPYRPYRGPRGY